MDLLSIARTIARHKLATIPVIILTAVGAYYVVAVKERVYEATSSFIMINPPAPPTADEIARDPELGQVKTDNPYLRFGDQSVIVDLLARTVNSDAARKALVDAGADGRYAVAPSLQFGFASPIVEINGVGPSAEAAMKTATLVSKAVTDHLNRMQRVHGTDLAYRIRPMQVDVPDRAKLRASGQLRLLVGVLGLGAIVMFVLISVADAFDTWRRERGAAELEWPEAEAWPDGFDPEVDDEDENRRPLVGVQQAPSPSEAER
jgi:hypothetical protein